MITPVKNNFLTALVKKGRMSDHRFLIQNQRFVKKITLRVQMIQKLSIENFKKKLETIDSRTVFDECKSHYIVCKGL